MVVSGAWVPRAILGRLHAAMAYIRMILCSIYLALFSGFKPDVVIVDQVNKYSIVQGAASFSIT